MERERERELASQWLQIAKTTVNIRINLPMNRDEFNCVHRDESNTFYATIEEHTYCKQPEMIIGKMIPVFSLYTVGIYIICDK